MVETHKIDNPSPIVMRSLLSFSLYYTQKKTIFTEYAFI